jgi:hypothetical protein
VIASEVSAPAIKRPRGKFKRWRDAVQVIRREERVDRIENFRDGAEGDIERLAGVDAPSS